MTPFVSLCAAALALALFVGALRGVCAQRLVGPLALLATGAFVASVGFVAWSLAPEAAGRSLSGLNYVWGEGLEAILGTGAAVAALPALWWWLLPRYTAVCAHDGRRWLADVPGVWSAVRGVAAGDLEPFVKQWLGQSLTGRFLTAEQARLPVNPQPRRHHVDWWGPQRGVYYVVGVRVLCSDLLQRFPGRSDTAPVRHELPDECLPL